MGRHRQDGLRDVLDVDGEGLDGRCAEAVGGLGSDCQGVIGNGLVVDRRRCLQLVTDDLEMIGVVEQRPLDRIALGVGG